MGALKKIDVLGRGSSRLSNIWPNIGVELCGFSRDEMAALRMLFQKASGAPVIIRLIKAMVCLAVALFGLLVAADNVIDYSTNFQFVQHVLSMDTIPDKRLIDRAITDPAVWRLSYAVIIVGEALTGLFFLAAAIALLSQLRAPPARFERATHGPWWAARLVFWFGSWVSS